MIDAQKMIEEGNTVLDTIRTAASAIRTMRQAVYDKCQKLCQDKDFFGIVAKIIEIQFLLFEHKFINSTDEHIGGKSVDWEDMGLGFRLIKDDYKLSEDEKLLKVSKLGSNLVLYINPTAKCIRYTYKHDDGSYKYDESKNLLSVAAEIRDGGRSDYHALDSIVKACDALIEKLPEFYTAYLNAANALIGEALK